MCKFDTVLCSSWFLLAALCVCGQLTDGKQTRTPSSWFITDISASDFAISQKRYTRQPTQEQNRMTDCTKRRSAWLGQRKHPIQNVTYIHALHTLTRRHTPEPHSWHSRLYLTQLYCPHVPSLAECAVCVEVLCEQLGSRLQAPQPSHLISPGWSWGLQSWGNTIHKESLIWTGPLYIALLIKYHGDSLTVF